MTEPKAPIAVLPEPHTEFVTSLSVQSWPIALATIAGLLAVIAAVVAIRRNSRN